MDEAGKKVTHKITILQKINLPLLISCIVFIFLTSCAHKSYAKTLRVEYIEYPPYYFTCEGRPSGLLLDLTEKVMKKAGVNCKYISMPSKRILYRIRNGHQIASIGWFKTAARENFAKFSIPIYQNKPIGILFRKKDERKFKDYNTLRDILQKTSLKVGLISGHSEGKYIDSLISGSPANTSYISGKQEQLVKMLKAGRFDFCLLAPEEVRMIIEKCGCIPDRYIFRSLDDIPVGNKRYLMFSKNVSDETIGRINKAINEVREENAPN